MAESKKDRYRLGPNLFKLSREKKDIEKALEEWELVNHELNDDKDKKFHCICNSWPWKEKDTYYNPFTKNVIEVGSACSDKFKKHAKPAMSNPAAQDMLSEIMKAMSSAEKLEYTDIANMLAYCQNAIQNLVAHVDAKLRDGTPLALTQLIDCLSGILHRQEELYLPTENIATLLQKLKARLAYLEEQAAIRAAALAAAEAVEAAERARLKLAEETRRQREEEARIAYQAEKERLRLEKLKREEEAARKRAEEAEEYRKRANALLRAKQEREWAEELEIVKRGETRLKHQKETANAILETHGSEDAYLLALREELAAKKAAKKK